MSSVESFYDTDPEREWRRLEENRTEYAVTMRAIHEYLAAGTRSILDVGGGPGRYAIALAAEGYDVTLFDLSRVNLALARQKAAEAGVNLQDTVQGTALDLSAFADKSFDAVLLMGPLYHLLELEDRVQAVAEAWRVLKPGGVLFAAFITRYSPMIDMAWRNPRWIVDRREMVESIISTGKFNPEMTSFTHAYMAHPTEVIPFMEASGLRTLTLLAAEGITAQARAHIDTLTGEDWEAWVDLNYRLAQDPSIYGAAMHLLYVGQK